MTELSRRNALLLAALTAGLGGVSLAAPATASAAPTALGWSDDWAAAAYAADPGAATASGTENAGLGPGLAFDNNGGTRFSSNFADDAWIRIDLGTVIRVTQVVLVWEAAYGLRYAVEVSTDGASWKSIYTENAGTGGTVTIHTHPQPALGRYVRMRGVQRATPYGYSLYAFQVNGGIPTPAAATTANLALNHPAFGNYYQDAGHTPLHAFDGGFPAGLSGDATRWASDWNDHRWVAVDLGASARISAFDLYWESAYAVDYQLQVSDDNQTWRTVYQPTAAQVAARDADIGTPGSSAGLHDAITLPAPVTGRYVRMLGLRRRRFYNPAPATAQFGYSLYEFQVWGTGGSGAAEYPAQPGDRTGTYRTVFFDDFTGATLDRSKWRVVVTGSTMGSVNGEAQAYIDSASTLTLANSQLLITPRYLPNGYTAPGGGTYHFTSARIDTSAAVNFTYGRVSARLKMPAGLGFWPAFWLLGSNVEDPDVSWPDCGETDIMENIGYPAWTSSALHGPGYSADGNIGALQNFPAGQDATAWHVYAVEWTPTAMRFSVDGVQTLEVTRQKTQATRGAWAYDHNQYVILNFALGGAYPAGWNKVTTPYWGLPQSSVDQVAAGAATLAVDWVRVEQLA
ncbi:discoidin domain-containing protein [Kitasatospora sp. NPDC049285]|uniref:discoidin domain-containing protein n=1 Tax=Kitasatospora sp. NPDC049285 TaxID=3157096 RepID=UPI00342A61C2